MYIIAGLGNPTKKYEGTRHNAGFDAIDYLADAYQIDIENKRFKAKYGKGMIEGKKVILAKPQTFMNLSGESIRELVDFFKIDATSELIVFYDDIDMDPGRIRIRKKGSAGGHNGIKNIIAHLGTQEFLRIKIGVGAKPSGWDLVDHVLSRFKKEERRKVDEAIELGAKAAAVIITQGADAAMNQFN